MKKSIKVFCWNIGNPSTKRAEKQIAWLLKTDYDVIVLTETKNSKGCQLIKNTFLDREYYVLDTEIQDNDYGVMAISKHPIIKSNLDDPMPYLNYRVLHFTLLNGVNIVGTYIPSRDNSKTKIERKKQFLSSLKKYLERLDMQETIFCGDFNILAPDHIPKYYNFKSWEYSFYTDLGLLGLVDVFKKKHPLEHGHSWIGRTGNGYRYDYLLCTDDLLSKVSECYYYHQIRTDRLSDHSAIVAILNLE